MKHCGTQRLESERLVLRRFVREDAGAMYKNWASDHEVTKYLTWPTHSNVDITKLVIDSWVNSYSDEKYYQWAIVLKENGWHQGITSEALKTVMDFFFEETDTNRIEAQHDPRNLNSGKVMEKCGMKYEGTLRAACRSNQGIHDACYYALLKSER